MRNEANTPRRSRNTHNDESDESRATRNEAKYTPQRVENAANEA